MMSGNNHKITRNHKLIDLIRGLDAEQRSVFISAVNSEVNVHKTHVEHECCQWGGGASQRGGF